MSDQHRDIGRCFDGCACSWARKSKKHKLHRVSRLLELGLVSQGIEGRSVVEVGCGVGTLTRQLLRRGGTSAVGVDLSEKSIGVAKEITEIEGLSERARFLTGDGSQVDLPERDVTVLDKVLCCYPNPEALLGSLLPDTTSLCGIGIPKSNGLSGAMFRPGARLINLSCKLRRSTFRVFVHEMAKIEAIANRHGFDLVQQVDTFPWTVLIYSRG